MDGSSREPAWWAMVALAGAVGAVAWVFGAAFAPLVVALLFAALAWRAGWRAAWELRGARKLFVLGGLSGGVALASGGLLAGGRQGDAVALAGAQIIFAALAVDPGGPPLRTLRLGTLLVAHALVAGGVAASFMRSWMELAAIATFCAGFPLLVAHAYWTQRSGRLGIDGARSRPWEGVLLVGGVVVVALLVGLAWAARGDAALWRWVGGVGLTALLAALAIVGPPPPLPRALAARPGSLAQVVVQAMAMAVFLNVAAVAIMLAAPVTFDVFIGLTLAWLLFASSFEYAALLQRARSQDQEPAEGSLADLTIVVCAFSEERVLADSMRANLAIGEDVRFLLVPATKSKDATVELCRSLAQAAPDRVRVVPGTSGSKAGDLNAAWAEVQTPYVLVLDADETIGRSAILRAMATLRAEPGVGIVQGRKRSRAALATRVSRFCAPERRYSTLMDHTLQSRAFDAAHFAGSGAFLRREVPTSVGGWREEALTEDIELTLRLHLAKAWRVVYDEAVEILESDPASWRALGRQRTRWARGWAQVLRWHLGPLLRARLPVRRAIGLSWQLLASVSAVWSVFLPALVFVTLILGPPRLPVAAAVAMLVYLVPSRGLAYWEAWRRAPEAEGGWREGAWSVLCAYAWLPAGWLIQLHAVYLEVSESPSRWFGTQKRRVVEAPASAPERR